MLVDDKWVDTDDKASWQEGRQGHSYIHVMHIYITTINIDFIVVDRMKHFGIFFTLHIFSDVTSPEWDDLMKIDRKISELGFGEEIFILVKLACFLIGLVWEWVKLPVMYFHTIILPFRHKICW